MIACTGNARKKPKKMKVPWGFGTRIVGLCDGLIDSSCISTETPPRWGVLSRVLPFVARLWANHLKEHVGPCLMGLHDRPTIRGRRLNVAWSCVIVVILMCSIVTLLVPPAHGHGEGETCLETPSENHPPP
eukprot:scaffold324_cov326-Pavlova_lutheri.AAC.68